MKVLITGAGGCIGAWVIHRLMQTDATPIAFDLSDDKRRLRLLLDDPGDADAVVWHTGDIADAAQIEAVFERHSPDAVIHLAALQAPFCKADAALGARVNVLGTVNVFEAARRHGMPRLAYASSVAADAMEAPAEGWLQTLYGAYKICNEQTARVYWQDARLPSVGIRPSVVFGAARDQGMSAAPTLAMLAACAGRPYRIPFCGAVGFVYAADIAAAFIAAVQAPREGAAVFNFNGEAREVQAVVDAIVARCADADISCGGAALPFPSCFSNAPLLQHIGAFPQTPFDEALDATLELFSCRLSERRLDAAALLS